MIAVIIFKFLNKMQQKGEFSYEQKIMLCKSRFRSTKDLWLYMTERLEYLMPSCKHTRLDHIQAILQGKKKVLHQKDVPAKIVPMWPELSVKRCYQDAMEALPDLKDYLPDPHGKEQRLPERDFFWKVMYSLHPETVENFIAQCEDQRRPKKVNLQE